MKNVDKDVLLLFARHPNYLLKFFFAYYLLSNEQIVKFKVEFNWGYFSSKSERSWDQSFIEEFTGHLNWDALLGNPSLPWSMFFLKAFPGRFRGSIQSINPSLPRSYEFIMK